ncbi:MAG: molybdopterin-dependent oxidoreductase [Deltaproteobacteria bacterium]|nr:molybdopterin-dependent oxidoreductase [Deltaproteobacteria bacterium]
MPESKQTFCRICEALCGLTVEVEQNRVVAIHPDEHHVATRGYACTKGLRQHELYDSPDRLRHPLRRRGPRGAEALERASWDDAIGDIGARVRAIRDEHGPDAIAMYVGTAAGFGVLHPVFAQGFMTGLVSRSMYASASQDCSNKFAVARAMYGFPFTQPFPDIDRTGCLVIVGANPAISKWSFLQVPNPIARLKAVTARGGKLWFIDPRRTESAKVAGEHVFIRPGTDVFFYLAFLHEVLERRAFDEARIREHMRGFDGLRDVARPWSPERAAEVTGIAAETLRAIVTDYLAADGAALYCSTGVNMGPEGSLAFWLQESINAITGNLDRRGGTLVGQGVIDFPRFGAKHGVLMRSDRSRVGDFSAVNDAFPGGTLADEILTPGAGKIRALFVTGGNPLITMAGSARLRQALSELELLVVLDILPTETASIADWVLPCTSPLERPDLPFIFPLMLGLQARPYLQATERVIETEGEVRDEATIYLELCRASGISLFGSRFAQKSLELLRGRETRKLRAKRPDAQPSLPQRSLLSWLLRVTGQGGFDQLEAEPHGKLRPDHEPGSFLGRRILTSDGRLDLAPRGLVEGTARLESRFDSERRERHRLKLITKRAVTTHNSWTHNLERFVAGDSATNYLYMHPDDAARLGLADGSLCDVRSSAGAVRVPMRLLADLMPGTVALPHGWGHQAAKRLRVASRTGGVNVNLLAADGPANLEPFSGMAQLTAIPVEVELASGPRAMDDWSGMSGPAPS